MDSSRGRAHGTIVPMQPTPGGVVDPHHLVGRETELLRIIEDLPSGGSSVLGDRRFGKTSILNKLALQLRQAGHTVIRVSAETDSPETFGQRLLAELERNRVLAPSVKRWRKEFGGDIAVNVGVFGFKVTAKGQSVAQSPRSADLFTLCAEATRRNAPYRTVFILDEITTLSHALSLRGDGQAEEFMRNLRVPRQELGGVSMVLAGSIGLHHAISDMTVVADLDQVRVGPLAPDDAIYLARCLLRGCGIAIDDEPAVAAAIADCTSGIPFYIQALVHDLHQRGITELAPAAVGERLDYLVRNNLLDTKHYVDRLGEYYGDDAPLALAMLDAFALADQPLTIAQVAQSVQVVSLGPPPTRDRFISLVDRLELDHYLIQVGAADTFATPFLRRAWLLMRRFE